MVSHGLTKDRPLVWEAFRRLTRLHVAYLRRSNMCYLEGKTCRVLHPRKFNSSPLKSYLPNRKVLFQPPFFRVYVKLRGTKLYVHRDLQLFTFNNSQIQSRSLRVLPFLESSNPASFVGFGQFSGVNSLLNFQGVSESAGVVSPNISGT